MGLYDRNYIQQHSHESAYEHAGVNESSLGLFIKQTYQLFAASLLAASAGAYVGIGMAKAITSWYWGLVILEFVFLFGLYAAKRKAGLNMALLFGFTFLTGLTLTPLLSSILGMKGGASIVANAFILTTVAFGGLSVCVVLTLLQGSMY
jgi:modulator of FtsH protease